MMNKTHLAAAALAALLAGCGSTPSALEKPPQAAPVPVGPGEYLMSDNVLGARAYVYGGVTVIEWREDAPGLVTVRDGSGRAVPVETLGRYMRADRRLDRFSASRMGVVIASGAMPSAAATTGPAPAASQLPAARPSAAPAVPAAAAAPSQAADPSAARADALSRTMREVEAELAGIRRILASKQARDPKVMASVNRRIDALERRVAAAQKPAVTVAQR